MPTLYVMAASLAVGVASGAYGAHTWYKARMVEAVEDARTAERAAVSAANKSDKVFIDRINAQWEAANARAEKFEKAFTIAANSLRKCSVSPDLLRVLNDLRDKDAAGVAAKSLPAPKEAEAGSDCAEVIATYRWNIENVIEPNRIQVEELQNFYNRQREIFNKD